MALSLDITYDLRTNSILSFTDNTDWNTYTGFNYGVPVQWILRCKAQGATFYENTNWDSQGFASPDLSVSVASGTPTVNVTTQNVTVNIPTNSDLSLIKGDYRFDAYAQWTDTVGIPTVETLTRVNINFTYSSPTQDVTTTYDCLKPQFSVTDNTVYKEDGITPTESKTITVTYPTNAEGSPSPYVATDVDEVILGVGKFYVGIQQVNVENDLTYAYSRYTVLDKSTYYTSVDVDCEGLCEIYCCLQALRTAMNEAESSRRADFPSLQANYVKAMALAEQYDAAIRCNKTEDVSSIVEQIKQVADCDSCNCGCDEGTGAAVEGSPIGATSALTVSDGTTDIENVEKVNFTVGGDLTRTVTDNLNNEVTVQYSYDTPDLETVLGEGTSAGNNKIENLADGTSSLDAINLSQLTNRVPYALNVATIDIAAGEVNTLSTTAKLGVNLTGAQKISILSAIVYASGGLQTTVADSTFYFALQVLDSTTPNTADQYMVSDRVTNASDNVEVGTYTKFSNYQRSGDVAMLPMGGDSLYVSANTTLAATVDTAFRVVVHYVIVE